MRVKKTRKKKILTTYERSLSTYARDRDINPFVRILKKFTMITTGRKDS